MVINKSYNEVLKQFPHEILYGTILKTVEIGPTANQAASTFAIKMKNNWATIGIRITRARQKKKKKTGHKKNCYNQTRGQSIVINKKFDKRQIGYTIYWNIQNVECEKYHGRTIFTRHENFPKFYAFLIKKTPPDTPLATTWNYSTKEEYEIERILQKKQGDQRAEFLEKWKNYDISKATWEPKVHLKNAQTALKQFRRTI